MSGSFATTHWSMVVAAGGKSSDRQDALSRLCQNYWYPLYAYLRRKGNSPDDAQDLTQSFFAHLLEKKTFAAADQRKGKFRTFLLTALNNFVVQDWRKGQAAKRGGKHDILSLDFAAGEGRFLAEPADNTTPEMVYRRRWAMTLLQTAIDRLRGEFGCDGRAEVFEALAPYLAGASDNAPYAEVAETLNMSVSAVKVTASRMRKRCRTLLRKEVAETVASEEDVDEELRDLFDAISG